MSLETVDVWCLEDFKELFNPQWRYICFYGGRGSGKSYNVALSLIIRARRQKLRILCTREIQNTIKDSVHKLLSDIIERYGFSDFYITKDLIRNSLTGSEFIFKGLRHNTSEIKSMEGVDVAWVEEAQAVTANSWDILTPTIRKPNSQIIITFNRLKELDPVWVKFCVDKDPKTYVKQINYDTLLKYGLFSEALEIERQRDEKDPKLYAWKWLGEPLSQDDNSIISRQAILKAFKRTVDQVGRVEIGVDVARLGGDRTVFAKRRGYKLEKLNTYKKKRTPEICDLLEHFCEMDRQVLIKIDDTGVGGGVTDEMLKRGYNVCGVNFGANAKEKDKYPNLISEAWFYLAEIMEKIHLPENLELMDELTTRRWQMDTRGRRAVESKDAYKKRGHNSPDLADAVILSFYQPKQRRTPEYGAVKFLG